MRKDVRVDKELRMLCEKLGYRRHYVNERGYWYTTYTDGDWRVTLTKDYSKSIINVQTQLCGSTSPGSRDWVLQKNIGNYSFLEAHLMALKEVIKNRGYEY